MSRPKRGGVARVLAIGGLLTSMGVAVVGAGPSVDAQAAQPHWGPYQWSAGAETIPIRAFWLFDRTGDAAMHTALAVVANGWNSARTAHPELPFVAVRQDDANAGRCFVNDVPGWSVATACSLFTNVEGVNSLVGLKVGANDHLTGAALSIRQGLNANDTFTLACKTIGQMIGLAPSEDSASCMSGVLNGTAKWLTAADATAVLSLYNHQDAGGPTVTSSTTTTTTAPSSTSTAPSSTTTTTETPTSSSTTSTSTTTTSTTLVL